MAKINFQLSENVPYDRLLFLLGELLKNSKLKEKIQLRRFMMEELAIEKHLKISRKELFGKNKDFIEPLFQKAYERMKPNEKMLFHIWQIVLPDANAFLELLFKELFLAIPKGLPGVTFVSPERKYKLALTPNDRLFRSKLKALRKISCEEAWEISMGESAVVAVIDTGIFEGHPDINENLLKDEADNLISDVFIDGESNPNINDTDGHGTHIAGTIAAIGNNGIGIIGVAPKAKILPIKVFNTVDGTESGNIANALYSAAANPKVQIINNSWYFEGHDGVLENADDPALLVAIQVVISEKVICVFAAGNSGADISNYWLLKEPNTIVVGATNLSDLKLGGTNYSKNLTIAAPGAKITSLSLGLENEYYKDLNGTSMAAAHVSGALALYISKNGGGRIHPSNIIPLFKDSNYSDQINSSLSCDFRLNCEKLLS